MALRESLYAAVLAATLAIQFDEVTLFRESETDKTYARIKRGIDLVLASVAFTIALPVLLVCAIAICLETGGSPLFRQERVGLNGSTFRIFKLRTMRRGTEGLGFRTLDSDPRVTLVGKFLRSTRIDELPQLINILRGEMSIIGPRPLSATETNFLMADGFNRKQPGLVPRVKPGLIGLEQVNRKKQLSYEERFAYNAQYEADFGWQIDLRIFRKALGQCWQVCTLVSFAGITECMLLCLR